MGSFTNPFQGKGSVNPLDFHGQTVDIKVLDRRRDLVRVDLEVAKSPFNIIDQRNHQTIGLVGGSEGQPGPAGVHNTELPHVLALLLRDQGSNHRLAFVHSPQVLSGPTGIIPQRGGFNQQIQHCGNNLGRDGGGVDVDRCQFRVCEEERDMEISDPGVVVWSDAIVKGKRKATSKALVLGSFCLLSKKNTYWSPAMTSRVSFAIPFSWRISMICASQRSANPMVLR